MRLIHGLLMATSLALSVSACGGTKSTPNAMKAGGGQPDNMPTNSATDPAAKSMGTAGDHAPGGGAGVTGGAPMTMPQSGGAGATAPMPPSHLPGAKIVFSLKGVQ